MSITILCCIFLRCVLFASGQESEVSQDKIISIPEEFCEVKEQKLKPGDHYMDPQTCQIWYCRKSIVRYAEVDEYTCKEIYDFPEVYQVFFKNCQENNCFPTRSTTWR